MSAPGTDRRVLFVCTHNAGHSIVAAALLNAHQPPGVRADSAGTDRRRQLGVVRQASDDFSFESAK